MKIAIVQPCFLPYLGYWQLINFVDKFVILDDVNFTKRGWIHRNNILAQGKPEQFNICIEKASINKLILDLTLSEEHNWKNKMIKKIEHAYSKAPYYDDVRLTLSRIILNKEKNLSKFLLYSIRAISKYLNINTEIVPTSSIYPKDGLKGQDRIIDICARESVDTYVNPIGGKPLYDNKEFESNDIELKFLKMDDYYPKLSIIDLIAKRPKEYIKNKLLEEYELC
jgi:hypothetical protein